MKLFRLLVIAAMAATFSAAAWADGAPPDPKIELKGGGGSPIVDSPIGDNAQQPIYFLDASGDNNFFLNYATTALYIEIVPFAGENLSAFTSEIWECTVDPGTGGTGCGQYVNPQGLVGDLLGGAVQNPGVEFVFFGDFQPGHYSASVPEPSSMVLLLAGMMAVLLGLGIKLRNRDSAEAA